MISYEWNAPFEDTVKKDLFSVVECVLQRFDKKDMDVELLVDGNDALQTLNRSYRGLDKPTDVLSFPNYGEELEAINSGNLGSIVISYMRAKEQAEEYGHGFRREMCYLCAHGMFHLFGYDHMTDEDEKEMTKMVKEVLSYLQINRADDCI